MLVGDRLVHEDRVQRLVEGAVEAENEARLHRVVEKRAIEAADGRVDDVVEVALPAAIPLHRVVSELEGRDVRLPVGATDHLINGLLDRERAGLDQLGPVVERKEVLERFLRLLAHRDQVDELPVVLGREPDPLVMRDSPHRSRVHGAAQMHMQLSQFITERMRHGPKASGGALQPERVLSQGQGPLTA